MQNSKACKSVAINSEEFAKQIMKTHLIAGWLCNVYPEIAKVIEVMRKAPQNSNLPNMQGQKVANLANNIGKNLKGIEAVLEGVEDTVCNWLGNDSDTDESVMHEIADSYNIVDDMINAYTAASMRQKQYDLALMFNAIDSYCRGEELSPMLTNQLQILNTIVTKEENERTEKTVKDLS